MPNDVGIFPVLPGLAWSVTKMPFSQTRIQRAVSGRELRALDYPYPLYQFQLVFNFLRQNLAAGYNELNTLLAFVEACQGAFGTFLFDDPSDDTGIGQGVGVGDGVTETFQLVYGKGGSVVFVRPIDALKQLNTVYYNGSPLNPTPGLIYSAATGLNSTGTITFTQPPDPGYVITADFTYYFRCRFVDDSQTFENFMLNLWELKKLNFISVFP